MQTTSMAASSAGVYRSRGLVSNFKIRVRLERRTVAGPVRSVVVPGHDIELQDIPSETAAGAAVDTEERIVGWQEKLFSRNEIRLYADEKNCHNARHHQYRQLITGNDKRKQTAARWIFTYVDEDVAPARRELLTVGQRHAVQTVQVANADSLRQRRISSLQGSCVLPEKKVTPKVGVSVEPTRVQRREWHSVATSSRVMRIMADLGSSEVVLCTIAVDEHGIVRVEPDFRRDPFELHLDLNDLGKETYWCSIENASDGQIDEEDRLREKNIQNEVHSHRKTQLSTLIGHGFESVPCDATTRVHVFGEIISAEDYEYDNLYVNFFLDVSSSLPHAAWVLDYNDEKFPVHGATHTSATKFLGNRTVAYFGYPFVYRLNHRRNNKEGEDDFNSALRPPPIMFQVMSRDAWNRFRTEGYGSVHVPSTPGCHTFRVRTWRPVARSLSGPLRRFFIGGSTELEDLSTIGVPSTHQGPILSKYGMQTETTGILTVKLQIVRHNQLAANSFASQRTGDLDEALMMASSSSTTALQSSVAAVLNAFHRARHRMLLARENLN